MQECSSLEDVKITFASALKTMEVLAIGTDYEAYKPVNTSCVHKLALLISARNFEIQNTTLSHERKEAEKRRIDLVFTPF